MKHFGYEWDFKSDNFITGNYEMNFTKDGKTIMAEHLSSGEREHRDCSH